MSEAKPVTAAAEEPKAEQDASAPSSKKYEYLDHTADIQVHAWGDSLKESFEQCVVAMFGYMTELDKVDIDTEKTSELEVSGTDLLSLLFALLDEFLFRFSAEDFLVCKRVEIVEFDTTNWKIRVRGYGEPFDLAKHPQGTEIKAITYSNMQIHDDQPTHDVYVILDI
ncbi:archease [Salpingoeca rosetta]|uniref:Archease n=1 Tax=Salpingoeca rosetta (strain ATCC 50818 / BSB-021) TaxID=946362 RepID=F2U008_SALR5|nr:archease [Salpingoeca rosetta]EGD80736.1 archease [Salpingoeca rosetta]|eukprot:XP_004997297.1 archease [Salpingoeca rosetta]